MARKLTEKESLKRQNAGLKIALGYALKEIGDLKRALMDEKTVVIDIPERGRFPRPLLKPPRKTKKYNTREKL